MSSTGWISIPFGARPLWPWSLSKNPTPVICTGIAGFGDLKLVPALSSSSNACRAAVMPGPNGLWPLMQPNRGISAIMVRPSPSDSAR